MLLQHLRRRGALAGAAPPPLPAPACRRRLAASSSSSSSSSSTPRRPPPNPGPARPRRGRREPPAPLLDFGEDGDEDDDDDNIDDNINDNDDDSRRRTRRAARLEAAYARVVSQPSFARDGDVRLYFKKRRLLAERAALEDDDARGGGRAPRPALARSWVGDNDALPRPDTAFKLSPGARAQVIGERAEALARALGLDEHGLGGGEEAFRLCSALLARHPGLLARATSELAAAARGHVRSARLGGTTAAGDVLRLAAEAPRLLLAHPDAAEARAGLLGRALVVGVAAGGQRRGGSGGGRGSSAAPAPNPPASLPSALLWRYPSALGTARARPLVEWAEALAVAVACAAAATPRRSRGPRAGAPSAGVAESLAVLAAGVELLLLQQRRRAAEPGGDQEGEEAAETAEGFARDAWLQRAGPEVAAGAVATLAARLLSAASDGAAVAAPPLFPLLRAEPALLLRPGDPMRADAWHRLDASLRALERVFVAGQEDAFSSAAAAAAARAVLLAPRLARAIPRAAAATAGGEEEDGAMLAALKEALGGLASTEWLFGPEEEGGWQQQQQPQQRATAAARRHPRLLLAALERPPQRPGGGAPAPAAASAMDARADRLARAVGASPQDVRRAARADPSLLAAPPALVRRALLRLGRGLLGSSGGSGNDEAEAAAARLASRLWAAIAAGGHPACAGVWAAAERGWLPLQTRALCACLRLPAADVRRVLLSSLPPEEEEDEPLPLSPQPRSQRCQQRLSAPPPALAALAASPSELRAGHARLTAALRRLAERRRWRRPRQGDQQQQMREQHQLPAAAAEARLAAALIRGQPALAATALAPGMNAAAVSALDACGAGSTDADAVEAVYAALSKAGGFLV